MDHGLLDLSEYSCAWRRSHDGVWKSDEFSPLSYPENGNDLCFHLENRSFWFRHRNNIISALLGKFPPRGTFFDVGGGNGVVTQAVQDIVPAVLVEPGPAGVLNAQKRGVRNIVQSMWSSEIVKPEAAAAVGLFDVLEHIENQHDFLRQVHTTVAKEGLLFVTVPAMSWLWSIDDVSAGHYRRYDLAQVRHVMQEAGFEVLFSSYMFSLLPLPVWLIRSLPSKVNWRESPSMQLPEKEYVVNPKTEELIVAPVLRWELRWISKLRRVPIGTSCVVVGKKSK